MARETTSNTTAKNTHLAYQNGVLIKTTPQTSTLNGSYVLRGDIVHEPVLAGFRKPRNYVASGFTREPAMVGVAGGHYTNAGQRHNSYTWTGLWGSDLVSAAVSPPAVRQLITNSDRDRALIELLKRIGDAKWSAGQALIEAQSSIDMIGKSAATLQRAMMSAVRKDWRGVARALSVKPKKLGEHANDVASGWLQYSFGWVPVVEDAVMSAAALNGLFDESGKAIVMAKTSQQLKDTVKSTGTSIPSHIDPRPTLDWKQTNEFTDELKMSLYFKLRADFLRDLSRYGIVGASTIWAVQPMSFVADWFLPIGDWLAAMDALIGIDYLGGSYTTFRRVKSSRVCTAVKPPAGDTTAYASGTCVWLPAERFEMNRVAWNTVPLPAPTYVKNPLSPWKAVTSIALLKQFTK